MTDSQSSVNDSPMAQGGRPQSLARLAFRSARHPKNCDCGVPGLLGMSGFLLARVREPSAVSAREADGNGGPLSLVVAAAVACLSL